MKKLNRQGFTLIELLAVVVILLAISVIAVSSISAAIERNKEKQDNAKLEIILNYAKLYYEENKNNTTIQHCIELNTLKNALQLSDNEITKSDGKKFQGVIIHNQGKLFALDSNRNTCS